MSESRAQVGSGKSWLASLCLLALALALGSQTSGMVAASAIFEAVGHGIDNTSTAGTIAGRIFAFQNRVDLVVLLAVIGAAAFGAFGPRRGALRWGMVVLALALGLLLIEMLYTNPAIAQLRGQLDEQFGSVSAAPSEDPSRRRFAMLHGMSMLRAVVQLALGVSGWLLIERGWRKALE